MLRNKSLHISKYLLSLNFSLLILLTFIFHLNALASEKIDPKELEGYEVKFDYEGHPKEREIAYQYCIEREIEDSIEKEDIGIDLYDIDNDGVMEILIYLNTGPHCGSAGCAFEILKLSPSSTNQAYYKPLPLNLVVPANIKILNSMALGYHDIGFDSTIWRWNGKKYKLYKKN